MHKSKVCEHPEHAHTRRGDCARQRSGRLVLVAEEAAEKATHEPIAARGRGAITRLRLEAALAALVLWHVAEHLLDVHAAAGERRLLTLFALGSSAHGSSSLDAGYK
jgi:hypothetical protein